MATHLTQLNTVMSKANEALKNGVQRIHELETALNRMILAHENTLADTEGRWPQADSGCVYCTHGVVPKEFDTGPCAWHAAKKLLGQL